MKKILHYILTLFTFYGFSQDLVLDPNFGNNASSGYLSLDRGATDYFKKVISNESDMLYYVGYVDSPVRVAVSSTTADGSQNPAFGGDFTKTFQVPGSIGNGSSGSAGEWIDFQSNKLIVGTRFEVDNTNFTSLSLMRLNLDGTLDTTFATNGHYIYAPSGIDLYIGAIAVNDMNEIFIGGRYRVGNNGNFEYLIQKLTPNGVLDSTFGTNGTLRFLNSPFSQWISAFEFLDNGQILIAGTESNNQIFLLNSDGTFDNTFGTSGNVSSAFLVEIKDIKQINNGFLAAGINRNNLKPIIYKFNSTGFDTSFGVDGIAESTYTAFMEDAFINEEGAVYFVSNSQATHRIFKTETANNAIPFDTNNFELYTNSFSSTVIYGITQLTDESIVGAGIGVNLVNSTTDSDMFAIKLDSSSSLSIPNFEQLEIEMFPNPASNILSFGKDINGELKIYNVDGKLVLTKRITNESSVDVNILVKGVYIVNIITDTGILTKKLIKN